MTAWSATAKSLRGRAVVRDGGEPHRSATTLELFFDLVFVVAISRVAAALHHELADGHVADGVLGFVLLFFAVWWAWMGFTWFASAHDSDDVTYRLLTFVQILGALILAAGVTRAFMEEDYTIVVLGYIVMRVGLVLQWLRVAAHLPDQRPRALRYAKGIVVMQVLWTLRLALDGDWLVLTFAVLVAGELLVPWYAERAANVPPFHPAHIEERYGLLTIILLGESILSATAGFQTAFDAGGLTVELAAIAIGGLLLAFSAWWLYFDHPGHLAPTPATAFRWGYGHVVVFASLAAMGAGLHVAAESTGPDAHADPRTAALAVAIPVAGFLTGLAILMVLNRAAVSQRAVWSKLLGAAAVVLIGLVASPPVATLGVAAVMVALATAMVVGGATRPTTP
jgi:low temperature requirement protein LtrA